MNCKNSTIFKYSAYCLVPFTCSIHVQAEQNFSYDSNGNLISTKGISYTYDARNQLVRIAYPEGKEVQFSYDACGNKTEMRDARGATRYGFDNLGRMIMTTYPGGHTVRYVYDERGNIASLIYPDGEEIFYTYDEESRLAQVKDQMGTTNYEYYPLTQLLKKVTLPNETTAEYTYSEGKLVSSATYKSSKGLLLESTSYTFDQSNLLCKIETKTPKDTLTTTYTYDRLNRPVKAVCSDGRFEGYCYDAFGNCLLQTTEKGMVTFHFDTENRLVKSDDTEFFYDASGNLTKRVSPLGSIEYVYNSNNQLIESHNGDHHVSFEYDGEGNRVAKTVNGVRTIFIYDLASAEPSVLMELSSDQKGNRPLIKKYRFGLSRVSQQIEDDVSYYLNDPVTGHVAILITSNEKKSNHYEYDAFGNKKNSQRSLSNAYGFCNADMDPETGLIYLEGRYYDPQIGRFLTKDVELFCLQNPQQLNPYALKTNTGPSRAEPKDESYKIALAPSYQGVSHKKTKAMLSELRDLEGVILDRASGQIILFGQDKPQQQPISLADLYHVLSKEHKMGVYTENTGSEEISKVNYLGPTISTHVGNVLYEADRWVKNLVVGIDNITGDIVASHVPEYKTFIDRCLDSDIVGTIVHEHWLFPERLSLLASLDESALFVSELKMGMSSTAWHNNSLLNHPVVGAYRTFFVEHFDQLAEENPYLGSLATLEKLVGIGKWAQLQNLQIDASLFDLTCTYETPDQTSIYLARKNKYPVVENGPHTKYKKLAHYDANYLTIAENGGILCDLSPERIQLSSSELIDDLKGAILQSRPAETDFVWNAAGYTAVAQTLCLTPKLGNIRKTYTDMSFPVLGANPLELTRSYNAFDEKWEWTPASLKFIAAGTVLSEEGREILYTQDAETPSLNRSSDSPYLLVRQENGSFLLDKGVKGKDSFNAEGRLTQLTDGNGFSIRYRYEGGRLISIAHQNGRTISLSYKDGILLRAVGPGGKTLYYKHNDKKQLSAVADRRWNLSSYEYDEEGRLAKIFDAKDQLVETIKYDIYNRAIEENGEARRFNQREKKVEVQNPLNLVTTQEYDEQFRLVRAVDSQNRSLQLYYKEGLQAPEKVIDALGNETVYTYDNIGNLVSMRDALGNVYRLGYDALGNMSSFENPKGGTIRYSYDTKKRLVATSIGTRYTYNEAGNLASIIDAQGNITQYTYDDQGMLLEIRSPTGFVETRTYDDRSRLTRISDTSGAKTDYCYNDRDLLIAMDNTAYTHDDNGNLERIRDGNGYETAFVYDLRNNLVQVTDPEGGITRYEYDLMNHLTKAIFPNGSALEIRYDAAGQKVEVR